MGGVILVILDEPPLADRMLAAAGCFAKLTAAGRINALAVRTPPADNILLSEEVLDERRETLLHDAETRRAAALKRRFDAWVQTQASETRSAEWFDAEGHPEPVIARFGARADYVVAKRPRHGGPEHEHHLLHAALFRTGRPVLVVPPEPQAAPFGRRVAIAWRDDSRTIQAVLPALRWLGRAEKVIVLAGVRDGASPPSPPAMLDEHGVAATMELLPVTAGRTFGADLLARAQQLGVDLLVMGAFVHPVRNLILGGVTRHVLAHAAIPVLMRH
jgi:nucleotide-binding universal stress UspA family protein